MINHASKPILLLLIVLFTTSQVPISAQLSEPSKKPHVTATLLSEVTTVKPGSQFWIALHLKMAPGWHTYWKNPGDAGLETKIDWTLPAGVTAGPIQWPYPTRYDTSGIISLGYEKETYLFTRFEADSSLQAGQRLDIGAQVKWLECKEICIPGGARLTLNLSVTDGIPEANGGWTDAVRNQMANIPLDNHTWTFQASQTEKTILLEAIPSQYEFDATGTVFFPDRELEVDLNFNQSWEKVGNRYQLSLTLAEDAETVPTRVRGVCTNTVGWSGPGTLHAIEIDIPIGAVVAQTIPIPEQLDKSALTIPAALGFAFLGGLILNLMPCVFPVLSIKVLGFVKQSQEGSLTAFKHGLIFTAGVLLSFWALAGALLLIRLGGEQVVGVFSFSLHYSSCYFLF